MEIYLNDKEIVQIILCDCKLLSINTSTINNKLIHETSDVNIEQTIFGGSSPDLWHLSLLVVQMSGYQHAISKCGVGKR